MCRNGRWRGFASATKRMAMSMTDPGRAHCARQLLETTACWSASQLQGEWTPASRTVRWILARNGLQGRIAAQKPALKKETAKKPCCVRQGPQPGGQQKVGQQKNIFFRWIVSWAPSQAPPILSMTLRGPRFTQETVKFGGGKIMVWGELWDACKVAFHAIPDDFINKLSAKPDGNCSAGQRNPYKILIT